MFATERYQEQISKLERSRSVTARVDDENPNRPGYTYGIPDDLYKFAIRSGMQRFQCYRLRKLENYSPFHSFDDSAPNYLRIDNNEDWNRFFQAQVKLRI